MVAEVKVGQKSDVGCVRGRRAPSTTCSPSILGSVASELIDYKPSGHIVQRVQSKRYAPGAARLSMMAAEAMPAKNMKVRERANMVSHYEERDRRPGVVRLVPESLLARRCYLPAALKPPARHDFGAIPRLHIVPL